MDDAKNHGEEVGVDLFGNKVFRRPGKKGRPPFERTDENANLVSMLLAAGWQNERIASVIRDPRTGRSISVPTLKRYFRPELQMREVARDQMKARELMRAWAKAEEGNVGAMKLFRDLLEDNDRMVAAARMTKAQDQDAEDEKAEAAMPAGKKERTRADAERAVEGNPLFTPGRYN